MLVQACAASLQQRLASHSCHEVSFRLPPWCIIERHEVSSRGSRTGRVWGNGVEVEHSS